jgi:hypothetical protein
MCDMVMCLCNVVVDHKPPCHTCTSVFGCLMKILHMVAEAASPSSLSDSKVARSARHSKVPASPAESWMQGECRDKARVVCNKICRVTHRSSKDRIHRDPSDSRAARSARHL